MSELIESNVYKFPKYYAIGYQWNTKAECDFLEDCLTEYTNIKPPRPKTQGNGGRVMSKESKTPVRVLDIGCGAGRHLLEFARRGYEATGLDLRPEMVKFVKAQARAEGVRVDVSVGDLRDMTLQGSHELAFCLMDTFRFLLTNEEIVAHLQEVGRHLIDGGLYVTDFWIPTKWDQIANEIYQWEQTEGDTKVRVFYVQHPESVDPISQTFEDELVFAVEEGESSQEIRGGRTRTRLLMPQEFRALVATSGAFEIVGTFSEFDIDTPFSATNLTWRMVTVLKKIC